MASADPVVLEDFMSVLEPLMIDSDFSSSSVYFNDVGGLSSSTAYFCGTNKHA